MKWAYGCIPQVICITRFQVLAAFFKSLGGRLAACFLLLADPGANSQEPVTRSQWPAAENL